jgi:hypothetical protein
MSERIPLNWSSETIINEDTFPRDTLGRVKYAEFLTQFLVGQGYDTTRSEGDEKRNYVLNLNSEWGSGKTYFLKRWSNDLQNHFPVVYIDAWQQDYSDDPLMTALSSVIKQLRDQAGMSESDPKFQLPKKALGLLKAAAPGFARSVAKRYLDIDLAALMQEEEPDIQDENGLPINMGELASTMVKQLIDEHDGKKKAIDDLKVHVEKWVDNVVTHKKLKYPAFIFIDELDRCLPSYAVEMLETIKHIFDIKGIVFVVATDTEQLQHAVKAIYGEGFNARLYLGRFFNSRFSLKAPDLKSFLEVHTDISKLSGEYLANAGIQILPPNDDANITLSNISVILDAFKMPPRTAIQIADRVVATISNMPKGSKIDILMLTTLLCFYEQDHERFQGIIAGDLKYQDKSGKDAELKDYIQDHFGGCELLINMRINPLKLIPTLTSSDYGPHANTYGQDTYKFLFKEYLKYCFLELFSKNSIDIHLLLGSSGQAKEDPVTNLFDQLISKNHTPLEIGLLWFKILRCHYGVDSISSGQYQDYVELASALDLIEEESKDD